jgi:hypothetical protein
MTGIVTLPTARTLVLAPVPPATPATPVTLPLSGWHVSRLEQPDGRSLLEVADADGDLVGLAGSTIRPALSVDAAWRGVGYDASGNRRWWALAIGHAGANGAQPVVTFTRHVDANRHPRRAVVRHSTWHGLWLAAAAGPYTSIS